MEYAVDKNWEEIKMPIVVKELEKLLKMSGYPEDKTRTLVQGFSHGFSIGYEGKKQRRDFSKNLPLGEIRTKTDLWNKVIKEVNLGRYVGPFKLEEIPFNNFIQSPIGLDPKAGNQTRLIFHLSYQFGNRNCSVNEGTPKHKCSVKYRDLDHAVQNCIKLLKQANKLAQAGNRAVTFFSKSDLKSAFCLLPILVIDRSRLLMKAEDLLTGEEYFLLINVCKH